MFSKSKSSTIGAGFDHADFYSTRFLKFFYTAKVNINESIVIGLLCLADKYNVQAWVNPHDLSIATARSSVHLAYDSSALSSWLSKRNHRMFAMAWLGMASPSSSHWMNYAMRAWKQLLGILSIYSHMPIMLNGFDVTSISFVIFFPHQILLFQMNTGCTHLWQIGFSLDPRTLSSSRIPVNFSHWFVSLKCYLFSCIKSSNRPSISAITPNRFNSYFNVYCIKHIVFTHWHPWDEIAIDPNFSHSIGTYHENIRRWISRMSHHSLRARSFVLDRNWSF